MQLYLSSRNYYTSLRLRYLARADVTTIDVAGTGSDSAIDHRRWVIAINAKCMQDKTQRQFTLPPRPEHAPSPQERRVRDGERA